MGQGSSMGNYGGVPPTISPAGSVPQTAGRPPARKTGLRILAAILFILLAISVVGNLILFFVTVGLADGGSGGGSTRVMEQVIKSGSRDKVAILPASGTVDEQMVERVRRCIVAIREDSNIKAVVLEVDSPGGSITASDEIHHMLMDLKAKNSVELTVAMRGLAASGGYYISMPADTIYAQPTTITGSIGVIWPAFEVTGLLEKIGVKPEIITSDQATFKDMASPFKKFTPEDVAYIKGLVNQAHEKFKGIVKDGRGSKLTVPLDEVTIGRVWTADDAKKMGLIDEIAYLEDACAKTAAAAGVPNATIVRLKERTGIMAALMEGSSHMGGGKIEISPKLIYEMQTPKMEYRWVPPWSAGQ